MTSGFGVTSQDSLIALERVLASEEFNGADRLKEFLTYVVQESISGRGDKILGKRIAQDVYGRDTSRESETANVVRVDAGRLRRRLDAYYRTEGAKDNVRIHVDKGGYAPSFSYASQREQDSNSTRLSEEGPKKEVPKTAFLVGSITACVAIAFFAAFQFSKRDILVAESAAPNAEERRVQRGVLFEASPASLQALNLAEEARTMMFPATQPTRLLAALILFEEAIELDPTYFGGHAGAAQASAMFAGLAPLGDKRDQMMVKARTYAETAVDLDPASAWCQSALALVNMFERNFEEANRLSQRAVSLDPEDLITVEIDAIIAFFSGDFDRARTSTAPERHEGRAGTRFPWRNVYGNASFYLDEYDTAVSVLLAAVENGEPVSEINSAHLIASLQASGRKKEAKRYLNEYETAWPESRIEEFMFRLFDDPENARKLISQLTDAGWQQ